MKNYFFDTNSLMRFFLRDVENQYLKIAGVLREIEEGKSLGRLSILIVAEVVWVFASVYKIDRDAFVPKLLDLIILKNIKIVECDKNLVLGVLEKFEETKFDFIDVYLSKIATKETMFSFDRDFEKLYK